MSYLNAEMAAYIKERDEMLVAADVDKMLAFQMKHNLPAFPDRIITEIALHKARTAAKSLPMEARSLSKKWLTERGYSPLDDGDVPCP